MPVGFHYRFHPVGQGLFASGTLGHSDPHYRGDEILPKFHWVYDCGTASDRKRERIAEQIGTLEAIPMIDHSIDLVTLSHFDEDHINGICDLLQRFPCRTLLLPYAPLFQRLEIAFVEGTSPDDPLFGFFVNPVRYLIEVGEIHVERILFVLPGGEEGPPSSERGEKSPDDDAIDDAPWPIEFEQDRPDEPDEFDELVGAGSSNGVEVGFMHPGVPITVKRLWEFLPRNEPSPAPISQTFLSTVNSLRSELVNAPDEATLQNLKRVYDDEFGSDSVRRNRISLFLYSGPVYHQVTSAMVSDVPMTWEMGSRSRLTLEPPEAPGRCSILYTGDGSLHTVWRINNLLSFLGPERAEKIAVFQVMHHGAKGTWRPGVAGAFRPLFSVFSSDPDHGPYHHPHQSVLRDFWPFGPIQVGKRQGAAFVGQVAW